MKKLLIIIVLLSFIILLFSEDRLILGEDFAKEYLEKSLQNKTFNLIGSRDIINDKNIAIKYAEIILFNIYGEKNIIKQKPYEVYLIDNYWIIFGTLPKNYLGGTFKIIIDKRNGTIINIGHDK